MDGNSRSESFEKLGILRKVVLFLQDFGKCCSSRYWKFFGNSYRYWNVWSNRNQPDLVKWSHKIDSSEPLRPGAR